MRMLGNRLASAAPAKATKLLAVAVVTLAACTGLVQAQTATYWQHDPAEPGDWFDPANWTNGVPTTMVRPDDLAYIDNGGSAVITGASADAGYLWVGFNNSGHLTQTGGTLRAMRDFTLGNAVGAQGTYTLSGGSYDGVTMIYVGNGGTGTFTQSGGVISYAFSLTTGNYSTSHGTFELSGTGQIYTRYQNVGIYGTGRFTQRGGSNSTGVLTIGKVLGADGTYELIGGTLTTGWTYIGGGSSSSRPSAGTGRFIQTGGYNTTDELCLGGISSAGSTGDGTYELHAGTLSATVRVGWRDKGKFLQTGGTLTGSIVVADGYTSNGSYEIRGGTVLVEGLRLRGRGTILISTSDANITATHCVWLSGTFQAVPGTTIHLDGHWSGAGTNIGASFRCYQTDSSVVAGLRNLQMIFESGADLTSTFEVAGRDMGPVVAGLEGNFAIQTLSVGGADVGNVRLSTDTDNQPEWAGTEALYVENLILGEGSTLDLNGFSLYYCNLVDYGGTVNLNGGSLTLIPEPASAGLFAMGLSVLLARRRRRRK